MFDADRAILHCSQDRLNRAVFAKYLARCMLDHKAPDSLVVGLYGGWGVGKTSIINMVIEELSLAANNMGDDEKPIILNFSPWSYSGQTDLIYSFFRRLSAVLRHTPFKHSDEIIYLLELYTSFHTDKPVPKAFRKKQSLYEMLTFKKQEAYAWESGRDLTLVKAQLNALLSDQKHKIIIIIDNISRLFDYEIKKIFQIVKSMADFSNTAYLLSLNRELVVKSLNKIHDGSGEEYVEKVIQLPFEVPPIMQQDLESILNDKLNQVIVSVPEDAWNSGQWADVYYSSLKYFFKHCRDITRYVNTIQFSYPRVHDLVNPVDFFALSAIEVFMPDVYYGIRDNKDLFTDLLDHVYVLDEKELKRDKVRCDEILSRNHHIPQEILIDLLMYLFPRLRHIYQPDLSFYHSDNVARSLRRICSPDVFDLYFRLSMQNGQMLQAEFDTIVSLAENMTSFDQAMTRLNQDNRILKFLDMLDSRFLLNIPKDHIKAIISSLLDNGDLFPTGTENKLSLSTSMRIHRIIHTLLQRIKDPATRFTMMKEAIQHANKSLYVLVNEVLAQSHQHNKEDDTFIPAEFRDFSPEQLPLLQQSVVEKIQYWARDNSLVDHPMLLPILFAWLEWDEANTCRQYVKKITDTDRGLVAFLSAILAEPITDAMTSYVKDALWEQHLHDIDLFISPHHLEKHAKELFQNSYFQTLREKEQLAIMIFLDMLKSDAQKKLGDE